MIPLAVAIAPCLALLVFIYLRDKYDREPLELLAASFFLGMLSTLPAIFLELFLAPFMGRSLFNQAFFGIGLVEELCKMTFVLILPFRRKAFNEPLDGIVYSVMVSMGFATLENVMYVFRSIDGLQVAFIRMFSAVPAHCMFGVMMGFFLGYAKFSKTFQAGYIVIGLAVASAFHGAYDYFLMATDPYQPYFWLGSVVALITGIIFAFWAISIHRRKSRLNMNFSAQEEIVEKKHNPFN